MKENQNNDIVINSNNNQKGKNYQYAYYYFPKYVVVQFGKKTSKGYYYVQMRLDVKFMNEPAIRQITGFRLFEEIPPEDKGVTIENEKTFHCAASKGLVGHVAFSLKPANPSELPDPQWGSLYNTRLSYVKDQTFGTFKDKLIAYSFTSPVTKGLYQVIPESVKPVRRKGDI